MMQNVTTSWSELTFLDDVEPINDVANDLEQPNAQKQPITSITDE